MSSAQDAMVRPSILLLATAPTANDVRHKRARSNSVSSSSSTSGSSSYNDGSVFSQEQSSSSSQSSYADSDSNCSSPCHSKVASPSVARPTKVSRRDGGKDDCEEARAVDLADAQAGHDLLKSDAASSTSEPSGPALSIVSSFRRTDSSSSASSAASTASSSPTSAVRTVFVDCLVDAAVHVLDMIWHAPIHKSIAFLSSAADATCLQRHHAQSSQTFARSCRCPVGSPFTGGLPLDVFIRETLRRSRTSCSTLQAALLYCKRIGGEVVRKRAELEGVSLTADDLACLAQVSMPHNKAGDEPQVFASLTDGLDGSTVPTHPRAQTNDPLLCSRRTFLAAVVVSSKFLQDRTYSNRAWSKISGLDVRELGGVERRMLGALVYNLAATDDEWTRWVQYLSGEWKASLETCHCREENASLDIATAAL